ncbi:insulin-induced gene 2 protein-like [Uloborus diversus]|uniref:insulin-induced gene 2 protein-like n=1 Tax=Uloborus diversus TaxID=327109 RepID=UPI002409829B|nr:insulin-induced gene 2 protein-like [Uloborus diversus]
MGNLAQLFCRGVILFLTGALFTVVLSLLQAQRNHTHLHPKNTTWNILCSKWWLPVVCGVGSVVVGLIYPFLKEKESTTRQISQEWSHVLRCIAMFVGINEACTKVDFPSNLQLSLSLAVLSVGLWWYFDRTRIGLGMGILIALLATVISQMLVAHKICIYSEREFLYMRSWLPCVVFSGGITVGNIGKQLALNDFKNENKSHAE